MRLPMAVFLILSGFYLLTMSGHTYSSDEETMLAVTRGLIERGDVAVVVEDGAPVSALRSGHDGRVYSPYGVLPSLLAIPLHFLGTLIAPSGLQADYASRFAVMMLNSLLTAATCAILVEWTQRLGATDEWALMLALLYGLATFAWTYARTFFSEPLAALLILGATERAWSAFRVNSLGAQYRMLFLSGLLAGLLPATRIAAAIALPVIGLYVLWETLKTWSTKPTDQTKSAPCQRRQMLAYVLSGLIIWIAGLLPGFALAGWYNLARFETLLASGYGSEAFQFTTPLAEGLFGLLLSPGKSVFLYAPPLLLAFPGGFALWRRGERTIVLVIAGLFLSHLLLYARWGQWPGGGVWGPRFLLPVVAPVMVLAAGLGILTPMQRLGLRLLTPALVLGGAGFVGNLGGVLLNFDTYAVSTPFHTSVYTFSGSPLVGHWRLLIERWARYSVLPPFCRLGDGLYASESNDNQALPRRTGSSGKVSCVVRRETRITLVLDDRRPDKAPSSQLRLRLNERDQGLLPTGQQRTYHWLIPPGRTRLEIVAQTWNPFETGFSDRNDPLGPAIVALRGQSGDGAALTLVDTAVAPLPTLPRPRWAWYYDPPNQHLVDHWLWYLPRSELTVNQMLAMGGIVVLTGTISLVIGIRLMLTAIRKRSVQ
ncbi:MAG: hypothetical protein J7463_06760 [Roseiflexus sp.]|nr:hypothetical protein [Roseiflexus sp.]MBO9381881.1 hypothetical protein [Roseiflexus sp.]